MHVMSCHDDHDGDDDDDDDDPDDDMPGKVQPLHFPEIANLVLGTESLSSTIHPHPHYGLTGHAKNHK